LPNNIDIANKYMFQAESLIELLEKDDCGSIGGHDKNNPINSNYGFKLYDRFITLVNKYEDDYKIENVFGFDKHKMGLYFKELSELRSKILK